MTIKVFWQDPYLTELNTKVKTVDENKITLEKTIFYAFSGGQESDSGTIAGYNVLKAEKDGLEIYYTLESADNLKPGDEVKIIIDWDRRYKLMRMHFATEIVLELVYKKFSGVEKVGAHIAPNKSRIDFKCSEKISPLINELQNAAQSIIDADYRILSDFSDQVLERRFWKIDGFGQVPCGGTHVKSTREIGTISLKRENPGKGIERVEIKLES